MIRNAIIDSDIRLRRLRRAAALWLCGGLLLLALGPWPSWSPTYGWSLVYALLLAPLTMLAWLLTLTPAGSAAWGTGWALQGRGPQAGLANSAGLGVQSWACRPSLRDHATTATAPISRRCRAGGVRGGAGSPA